MNNAKVRIYELSKELNLENKDLLTICEQLNIAVKSHSSTISEIDAERIKNAAEKYTVRTHTVKRQENPDRTSSHRGNTSVLKPPAHPPTEHKPQILQIKHKSTSGSTSSDSMTQVATPPNPPARPSRPSNFNPPSRPVKAESNGEEISPPLTGTGDTETQLTKPPASQPRKHTVVESPSSIEKPLIKKAPSKLAPKATQAETTSTAVVPKPVSELLRPQRLSPPSRPDGVVKPELAAKPTLQGVTSLKPKPAIGVGGTKEAGETSVVSPGILELKPKPTPPRAPKRAGKVWEEEEEETPESKANKAGVKGKRRPAMIEDDDDFAEDLEDLEAASILNISAIARPPKQKAATPAPIAAPTASKIKKPKLESAKTEESHQKRDVKVDAERPESVILKDGLTVRELAELLVVPETEIIKNLFFKGLAVNITQTLDLPTASMVTEELGVKVETVEEAAPATKVTEMLDVADLDNLQHRPPVVTIMGHVDHGKTTLLDAIRQTKVAQGEAGGITQHIGAYHVDVEHNGQMQQVVFLDTPGHQAFTAMRARGARVTDIAILVVAADDGVRPQTVEALKHAQAAEVPIIVAINKVDKPDAQPDRVEQELTQYGLVSEKWGGNTTMVHVSALKGQNLDELLEMILLVAELEELSANPDRPARGTVIEAHLDKAKGPVATFLVQNGTLRVGDILVVGHVLGKVRAMVDDRGDRVEAATPSFAVEVLGLNDVPSAGDEFEVFTHEKEARAIAEGRADQQRQSRWQQAMASRRVTLNTISEQVKEGSLKELNLLLKSDVQGSLEAILGALKQLPQREVQIRVLFAAPGEISETDVDLAAASGAVIVGFNTTLASGARQAADRAGVDVREYNIIYKLLDDIQAAMEGLLDPEMVEEPLGQVEVRAIFPVGRGTVAGCYVLSGKAIRNCNIRVQRSGRVVYQGILDSLKRVKDDVKEVNAGYECGIRIDNFSDWVEGDIIETFQMVSKRRTLATN
ncbi:translation initiation factor IF-2 [Merismopedia glauca]|uniref:Translation initiation factor IF-2 n=1 Tax=Merismopedia glauca CCAP 1448/3 TaxID=1296344 RepID=A0A2T1C1Y8_9CYAN|nr:translation initiation factor IF-2 [Merismopedia glauca]PSB02167.1 translation initiation factor IF-2 [Merismopedia glauca CCAP 1448/3]